MDYYDHPTPSPDTQYERIVLKNETNALIQAVKAQTFSYMDQLEGWCTKSKASVLIDFVFMLKPKKVVEIGVWGGKSLVPMANALKAFTTGKAYGIDPWSNTASAEGMDGENYKWWEAVDHQKILQGLKNKIVDFGLENHIELIQTTSEFAPGIPDIDILHIDGNHSEKASNFDVRKWVPLVRQGGLVIFDDITWGTNASAVQWLDENCIKLTEFHEENDWGIWIKS